jgi:xylulokinase
MSALLGIDVGTSATKVIASDDAGRVLGTGSAPYPLQSPRPGWTEQDPASWWHATITATRVALADAKLAPDTIAAIGLSGQMHGSVLLDRATVQAEGRADATLRPAILWNDQRTARQCTEIEAAAGGKRALVELVGNAALPGFTLPKLLWVRAHEPAIFEQVAALLLPKDYVRFRLTGALGTDVGDAAGTLLLDVDRRTWSDRAATNVRIDPAILPPVFESGAPAGTLSAFAAEQLGLRAGIPVAAGSGDNMAGAVGAGVVAPGVVLATLGTSGVIYAHADEARRDLGDPPGRLHTMCAADGTASHPGAWCVTGCTLSAAGSLQWCRDRLFADASFDDLIAEAAGAPPGCEGLLFLPYLTGERCPHPDPHARGAWVGMALRHDRSHLVRAVLEGVALTMAQILHIVVESGVPVTEIRIGGGGARSPLWRQILADAFNHPVRTLSVEEGPAHGAALLAGVAAGVWPSVTDACAGAIGVADTIEPQSEPAAIYEKLRADHGALYDALAPRFAAIGTD